MSAFGTTDAYELVEHLSATVPPPFVVSATEGGSVSELIAYDEARLDYVGSDFIVGTPMLMDVQRTVKRVRRRNRQRKWGRSMVLLSGATGTGKTTTLVAAARRCVVETRKLSPDHALPVLFVDAPAGATPKSVVMAFLHALRLNVPRATTLAEMTNLFIAHANDLDIRLVVVDELHNLADTRRSTVDAANMLKLLTNQVTATFIYSGIDIDSGPLMSGPQGDQLAGRSTAHKLVPVTLAGATGPAEWLGLIRAFESQLCLRDHPPGTLAAFADHLHRRTGGSIGSLRQLLVDAAMDIIDEHQVALQDGGEFHRAERIDQSDLDRVQLDLRAESRGGSRSPMPKKRAAA